MMNITQLYVKSVVGLMVVKCSFHRSILLSCQTIKKLKEYVNLAYKLTNDLVTIDDHIDKKLKKI